MGLISLPTSFVDGTIPTASQFNGDFNAIVSEANGNLDNTNIKASAGISVSKLAAGAEGEVIKVVSGVPAWAASSSAFVTTSVKKSGTQSINNATPTAVTFDSENFDTSSLHDTGSNTSRITVPTGKGGYWLVGGTVVFESNVTGSREAAIRKNGSGNVAGGNLLEADSNNPTAANVVTLMSLAAGDYVEIYATQKSGGALNIQVNDGGSGGATTEFWAIGPLLV